MLLFYLNILIHVVILIFVFSLFYKWKKKDFKKPFTQDNWLKLTILTVAIVPFTFLYGFIETTSQQSTPLGLFNVPEPKPHGLLSTHAWEVFDVKDG